MKKIIALILAMIMVVFAVAACGDNAGTDPTTTPTPTTQGTQGTTTAEPVIIPDPYPAVCIYTLGEEPVAVNIATGEVVGALTAGEGVELTGGSLYVVDVVPAEGKATATKLLGNAVASSGMAVGLSNKRSPDNPKNPGKVNGGSWWKTIGKRTFMMNCYMDAAALTAALGEESKNKFGTMAITIVDGEFTAAVFDGSEEVITLAEMESKWKFVYVSYDGSTLVEATGKEAKTNAMTQMEIIRYAIDKAMGQEYGYIADCWQKYVDNYGAPGSTTKCECEIHAGTGKSLQDHWQETFLGSIVPEKYNGALTNFNKIALDAVECKAALDAADAALAAAQSAFDAAVAANEAVAALKAAAEAEGATEEAKKAYTDAIAADANLKALNDALTEATTAQKTATTTYNNAVAGDENAEAYTTAFNEWKAKYDAFLAAYNEAANVALWDTADMDNAPLVQIYGEAAEGTPLPTFTYYYDAATDTYTVFVTSGIDANVRKSW